MERIKKWGRLLSDYFIAQALVQTLGIATGLMLVNFMPVREYALYTLALSALTFLSFFSDLGINNSLLYFRRETRINGTSFKPYASASLSLRRWIFLIGVVGVLLIFVPAIVSKGFATIETIVVTVGVIISIWFQINVSTRLLLLRIENKFRLSYLSEIVGNLIRLISVAGMYIALFMFAWLAMLITALSSGVMSWVSRKAMREFQTKDTIDSKNNPKIYQHQIIKYLLPTLPNAIYFSIQSPLIIWLSAYFGKTQNIAEVGALGRLGVIFGLISGLVGTVILPRLSAVTDERLYLRRYLQYWVPLILIGSAAVIISALFPHALLILLGKNYSKLEKEVVLVAATAATNLWGGYSVSINNARGWNRWQPIALGLFIIGQISFIASLDLSTTIGVLKFGLMSGILGLILQLFINVVGFSKPKLVLVKGCSDSAMFNNINISSIKNE